MVELQRLRALGNRKPIIRRVEDRVDQAAHDTRQIPDEFLQERVPELENRNIGGGRVVGIVSAAVATAVEDAVGVPFGASSDIIDTEVVDEGVLYTVNVNAPIETMAEARAALDSTTGFTSFVTDKIDVEDVEVQKMRIVRDTYQIDVLVRK